MATVAVAAGLVLAADPGSRDDPLVTMGYVRGMAKFQRVGMAVGQKLRLGSGAELVVLPIESGTVAVSGLTTKSMLVDLSAGAVVATAALVPAHHYVNGLVGDQVLKFDTAATVLVRGDWQ